MSRSGPRSSQSQTWHRIALGVIVALAAFLNFFRLEQEGYANLYYAAAVKSQLVNWHNWFFNAFDPGGFVTVDKPPLGLWIQDASALLFGLDGGLSLLLPQAIAGLLSVVLLYHLVRRAFGPFAGLVAALALAVTPIAVAAHRNNTMDSQLLLVLLLAAWAILRATETGKWRWLLGSFTLVGLGFEIKMLQAFLVLPAFYLLYLLAAPVSRRKRLFQVIVATVVLLVVSLSWVIAVDLTPPDERPYIGSSNNNTVLELIVGHNGLARLLPGGRNWMARLGLTQSTAPVRPRDNPTSPPNPPPGQAGPGGAPPPLPPAAPSSPTGSPPRRNTLPSPSPSPSPLRDETGDPGPLRLFNHQLAGQISWLLPLAGIGLLAAIGRVGLRSPFDQRRQSLLFWTAWLTPMVVFFSVANLFHRYYLEMMAPAIAALVGAGIAAMWADYREDGWKGWLLPLALMGNAAFEVLILAEFPDWSRWLTPLTLGLSVSSGLTLVAARLLRRRRSPHPAASHPTWGRIAEQVAVALGVVALCVPMLVWASIPVLYGGHAGLPYAGPDLLADNARSRTQRTDMSLAPLVAYLTSHQQGETFLAATLDAQTAAPIILETGEPVMAMGGFSGGDPILTEEELARRVVKGEVRFFLLSGLGSRRGGRQPALKQWIVTHCVAVPRQTWSNTTHRQGEPYGDVQLFDCHAGPG